MAFHMLGFNTALLASGASSVALGTMADQIVFAANNAYNMPRAVQVIAAYASNDAYTQVRLNAPSLRRLFLPQIDPVEGTLLPGNRPPLVIYGDMGPKLEWSEGVSVEASRGVVAASQAGALLWISDTGIQTVGGPIYSLLATSAVTISAGVWASGSLAFNQVLPAGKYQIVGMSAYGANLYGARLVFVNGGFRPGVLAQGAIGEFNGDEFRRGNIGIFGTFDNTTLPSVELYGVGAGTTQTYVFDLVKVG